MLHLTNVLAPSVNDDRRYARTKAQSFKPQIGLHSSCEKASRVPKTLTEDATDEFQFDPIGFDIFLFCINTCSP